jgi:hypothetical protein
VPDNSAPRLVPWIERLTLDQVRESLKRVGELSDEAVRDADIVEMDHFDLVFRALTDRLKTLTGADMPDNSAALIDPADLLIEAYQHRQIGGQHVGGADRGVKITHIPSGLVAISTEQGSQHRNRAVALDMLLGGLTSPMFR